MNSKRLLLRCGYLPVAVAFVSLLPTSAPGQLSSAGSQLWHQDSSTLVGTNEEFDQFGSAVATGDFNNDGHADLAIGVPREDIRSIVDAGTVHVIYGAEGGLSANGNQRWSQDTSGIVGSPEDGDLFGSSIVTGDYNGDGYDDLAIGSPGEDVGSRMNAGAVNVIYGAPGGLSNVGDSLWTQDVAGVEDAAEEGDLFGWSLASGDFNHDGYADLAIGVRSEDIKSKEDAGAVSVLYGSADGIVVEGNQFWHQDTAGIEDNAEMSDDFGWSLAGGDFDNDGYHDLAIGARLENVGGIGDAGLVNVIYGGDEGLAAAGNQAWSQNSMDIVGNADAGDNFGWSLAGGDFNNDGFSDLAVGVAREDLLGGDAAGVINVIYGAAGGLSSVGNQVFSQETPGIAGIAEENDMFGESLTIGDFDNDGFDDLAIGVSRDDVGVITDAGAVHVLHGRSGGLSADTSQVWTQDDTDILEGAEEGDQFGLVLAAGDFDLDSFSDLAIAVPFEDLAGVENTGAVNVIYGDRPADLLTDLNRRLRLLKSVAGDLGRWNDILP